MTLPQLAIAWVIQNSYVSTALAGMRTFAEVEENVEAVAKQLTAEDLATVDEILADLSGFET